MVDFVHRVEVEERTNKPFGPRRFALMPRDAGTRENKRDCETFYAFVYIEPASRFGNRIGGSVERGFYDKSQCPIVHITTDDT